MKNNKTELHSKEISELKKISEELKAEIIKLKKELRDKKLKNTSLIKNKFDDLARVLTVLNLKKNNE